MKSSYSILFYPRGNDINKNGYVPLYVRITVNGKRSEFSIKRKVLLTKWSSEAGKMLGNSTEAHELNRYMNSIQTKIHKIQETLLSNEIVVTADKIKNLYLGKDSNHKMLLVIFQEHNDQVDKLIGKDFAAGTAERYRTARKHVSDYILKEYSVEDIPVRDVDHKFITGFEFYLKTTRNCAHNTAIKYITKI